MDFEAKKGTKEDKTITLEQARSGDSQQVEFEAKLSKEKKEARENFGDLIELVSSRYQNLPENVRKDFIVHNGDILDSAIELGLKKGFSGDELKALESAAILHDIAKADQVPEEFKDIPNYTLVMHGEMAAREVSNLLTDEKMQSYGFHGDFDMLRKKIAAAIREHMGPHPGFMTIVLNGVSKKLSERGEKTVEHPSAQGIFSEALLAADMRSLASSTGREKIMSLRSSGDFFKQQDLQTSGEYQKMGVELSSGEAALISGFESAFQARDMIHDPELKAWIIQAIDESTKQEYAYGEQKIDPQDVLKKRDHFQLVRDRRASEEADAAKERAIEEDIAKAA